jgi:hypothetical protein
MLASWFTVFLHHDVLVEAAGLPAYFGGGGDVCDRKVSGLPPAFAWVGPSPTFRPGAGLRSTDEERSIMAALYLFLMAVLLDLKAVEGRRAGSCGRGRVLALGSSGLGTKACHPEPLSRVGGPGRLAS